MCASGILYAELKRDMERHLTELISGGCPRVRKDFGTIALAYCLIGIKNNCQKMQSFYKFHCARCTQFYDAV